MVHGSIAIPGKTDRDEVVITMDEIAASHLDYLALGHWHSSQQGRGGAVTYAYAGAPEPVALDQDRAGKVLLVELDEVAGKRIVTVEERVVGRTRFERTELDAATIRSQPTLIETLDEAGRPGPRARRAARRRPPGRAGPRHRRDRDGARAVVPQGAGPRPLDAGADRGRPPVAGHGGGRVHPRPRGAHRRAARRPARPTRPRSCATRCGSAGSCWPGTRSRCEDPAAPAQGRPPLSRARHRPRARADRRPRPERGRQDHDPARHRAGHHPPRDERRRRPRRRSGRGTRRRRRGRS